MEPLSIIAATLATKCTLEWITQSVVGGLIEDRSGKWAFESIPSFTKNFIAQFKDTPVPINHDLQKAILSSHWLATKVFAEQKLKIKATSYDALEKIKNVANEQLKLLKDKNYLPKLSPDAYQAGELILKDNDLKEVETTKQAVVEFHLAELRRLSGTAINLIEYQAFEENIRTDFDKLDWFELVCAFLNELLKGDNNKAKDAFQNQELAKIGVEVAQIKDFLGAFQNLANDFVQLIGENRFEEFKTLLKEDLAEIKTSLNRIEVGIENLQKGQDGIKEILTGSAIGKSPKELTNKLPIIHPNEVIGRETELTDLHKLLFANQQVVVVNGLGGIGKTTLAQAYLSQYYADYEHIAWISQSAENSLINDFVNADGLKENLNISLKTDDLREIFSEILKKLKALPEKPNLLLIDNAESNLSQLADYLPHQPNWHLLVTSRENIERFYMKELGFLSPEKASELFKTHCKLIQDEQAINDLLKTIDYHTLTIEILAKTAQKQHLSITKLKTAIENDLNAKVFVRHKGEKIDKVFSYLASIFNLSKLNAHEIWLMKQFACLPAEFIGYELLTELIAPEGEHEENFAETLAELVAKGWILTNTETDTYKMHRIIAEVATKKLNIAVEDIKNLLNIITTKLKVDQTKDNPIDKFQWIPYGKAIETNFEHETDAEISKLQNNLALVLKDLGDYEGAKKLLEKALISDEKNFGEHHINTNIRYFNLGMLLFDMKEYENAIFLIEKAYKFHKYHLGEQHPNTQLVKRNLDFLRQ